MTTAQDSAARLTRYEEFTVRILRLYWDNDCCDLAGEDLQDLAVKCGLAIERPITEEELKEDSRAYEYGCEPGDTWVFPTDETTQLLKRAKESP